MDKLRRDNPPDLLRSALIVVLMLVVAFVTETGHTSTLSVGPDKRESAGQVSVYATFDDCLDENGHGEEKKGRNKCCIAACPFLATLPFPPVVNSPTRSLVLAESQWSQLSTAILRVEQRPPIR